MRNLKKILALVLALVMSLSLMATAGAADATASGETITPAYQTAIDVLKGVKVFEGYTDGTFRPQNNITRAEVATILYRIATGDVDGSQSGIYTNMANTKFTDLAGATWAQGYINYCANAELIVGMGDGTFKPQQNITGYATLAMILRALGYDKNGEFKGSGWEIRTASTAKELGILKNVTESELGAPATRELVSELLFRAILNETVTYSPINQNGYKKTGETLAKKTLGLEEVKGVVMANEYANLDTSSTLKDGQTKLVNDTKSYLIAATTTLDDIGETRLAYIQDFNTNDTTAGTVLAMDGTGLNAVAESLKETTVNALLGEAGISGKAEGENYVNFDKYDTCSSEYRIKYVLAYKYEKDANATADAINNASGVKSGANLAEVTVGGTADEVAYIVTRVISPRQTITSVDQSLIEDVFATADLHDEVYYWGEVYVGTQSNKDISDEISYEKFKADYLDFDKVATVSGNENGNWVKVIDNDLDGRTDYIFKIIYTVAQVERVKDDTITLDTKNHTLSVESTGAACSIDSRYNTITTESVHANDELATGDVVYYAIIDGKVQTYLCDTATASIEKYVRKTETVTTTDGTEYVMSGVCEHIEDEAYMSNPEQLAGKTDYTLFFDRGGFLAAFVKPDLTSDYKLITDGWFNSTKGGYEYSARVYNDETGKQDIVDLTANGNLFIGRDVVNYDSYTVDNNDWRALKYLGDTTEANGALDGKVRLGHNIVVPAALNGGTLTGDEVAGYELHNRVRTTVAAITADGTILPVENSSVTGRYKHAMIDLMTLRDGDTQIKVPTKAAVNGVIYTTKSSNATDTAYNTMGEDAIVRALDNTVYYVVYPNSSMASGVDVIRTVGYANAPDVAAFAKKGWVEDIYAVGTLRSPDNNLGVKEYTADVVVVELNAYTGSNEIVLVLDDTTKLSDVRYRDLLIINEKGELETRTIDYMQDVLGYTDSIVNSKKVLPGLYYMQKTSVDDIYAISNRLTPAQITAAGCFAAGAVKYHDWTANNKYLVTKNVSADNTHDFTYFEGQYDLSETTPLYTVEYGSNGYAAAEVLGLEDGVDHNDVLASQVDDEYYGFEYYPEMRDAEEGSGHNVHYYNYNRVLVRYNAKGAAVYAVSFANVYNDARGQYDFARQVWENVIPATAELSAYEKLVLNAENALKANDLAALKAAKADIEAYMADNDKFEALTGKQINELNNLLAQLKAAIAEAGEGEGDPDEYAITVAETENGSAETSATKATAGTEVTITAEPDTGYAVDTITVTADDGTDVTVTDGKFTMPAQDVTVKVTFKVDDGEQGEKVNVTFTFADDSFESYTDDTTGKHAFVLPEAQTPVKGGKVTFTVADAGKEFTWLNIKMVVAVEVTVDGQKLTAEGGVYTIDPVTADTTVVIKYDRNAVGSGEGGGNEGGGDDPDEDPKPITPSKPFEPTEARVQTLADTTVDASGLKLGGSFNYYFFQVDTVKAYYVKNSTKYTGGTIVVNAEPAVVTTGIPDSIQEEFDALGDGYNIWRVNFVVNKDMDIPDLTTKDPAAADAAALEAAKKAAKDQIEPLVSAAEAKATTNGQITKLRAAGTRAENNITNALTEKEVSDYLEALKTQIEGILNASQMITVFNATGKNATVLYVLDDSMAGTVKPEKETILAELKKNSEGIEFTDISSIGTITDTGATTGTQGVCTAFAKIDGETVPFTVTVQRAVPVTIDNQAAGYVEYNKSDAKLMGVAKGDYIAEGTVATDTPTNVATDSAGLAFASVKTAQVMYSAQKIEYAPTVLNTDKVYAKVGDKKVALAATDWYAQKGAAITVEQAAVGAGLCWSIEAVNPKDDPAGLKEASVYAYRVGYPTTAAAYTTPDLNIGTVADRPIKITYATGYQVKVGDVTLPELAPVQQAVGSGYTMSNMAVTLTDGKYIAVSTKEKKECAWEKAVGELAVVSDGTPGTKSVKIESEDKILGASSDYAVNGVITLKPAVKLDLSALEGSMLSINCGFKKAVERELIADSTGSETTKINSVCYFANDAVLTIIDDPDDPVVTENVKLIMEYTAPKATSTSALYFTVGTAVNDDGDTCNTYTFSKENLSTKTTDDGFTAVLAEALPNILRFGVSNVVNKLGMNDENGLEDPFLPLATVEYTFTYGDSTVTSLDALNSVAEAGKSITGKIVITPLPGKFFTDKPEVINEAGLMKDKTVSFDEKTGVVTVDFTIVVSAGTLDDVKELAQQKVNEAAREARNRYDATFTAVNTAIDSAVNDFTTALGNASDADAVATAKSVAINAITAAVKLGMAQSAAVEEAEQHGNDKLAAMKEAGLTGAEEDIRAAIQGALDDADNGVSTIYKAASEDDVAKALKTLNGKIDSAAEAADVVK